MWSKWRTKIKHKVTLEVSLGFKIYFIYTVYSHEKKILIFDFPFLPKKSKTLHSRHLVIADTFLGNAGVRYRQVWLYEIICRHGCMRIQTNDHGREFVNEVITKLNKMTRVDQWFTPAYRWQANGLCERQNRIIRDSLVKMLNARQPQWPYVI